MDSDKFFCMQSLQASISDRDHCNKSICVNRAVTKISPAPSVTIPTAQSSISKAGFPTKKRIQALREKPWEKSQFLILKKAQFWENLHSSSRFL